MFRRYFLVVDVAPLEEFWMFCLKSSAEMFQSVLSLLQNSFSLFTRPEAANGTLQKQLRMYTAFSIQLLRHLQLLDENVGLFASNGECDIKYALFAWS